MTFLSCSLCGCETRHFLSTLRKILQNLPLAAGHSQQIPYACSACNHLGLSQVPQLLHLCDIPAHLRHPDEMVEFLVGLDCEQDFCESQVLVFAPFESQLSSAEAEVRVRDWSPADFTCGRGHRLRHPYQLIGMRTL